MSKATITGEPGAGKYTIRLEYNKAASTKRLAQIAALITSYDAAITALETSLVTLKSDLSLASTLLTGAIASGNTSMISSAEPAYYKAVRATELAQVELYQQKAAKLAIVKEKKHIEKKIPDQVGAVTATVWCGDYTEGLTGEVGLIEVKNSAGDFKVIQPGYSLSTPTSAYDAARDGAQTPGVSTYSGSALYRNAALLDGWELFKPLYRTGVITSISGDACSVTIDAQQTRYLALDANKAIGSTLTGVTIDYMDCHGGAFNVGDRVLVAFVGQSASSPRVIGFVDNPVLCQIHGVYVKAGTSNYVLRYHSSSTAWASRVNNTSLPSYRDWKGKYVAGVPTVYLAYNHNMTELKQYGKVVATAPQKLQGCAIATYAAVDYYIAVCKNNADSDASTGTDFWRKPVSGGSWTLIGSVPHSVYGLAATYEHMFPSKDAWTWKFSGNGLKAIHHQRIIIATPAFDASGDSWENEVPEQTYNGATIHNDDYYGEMVGGADRKAAIVTVTIAADLNSLSHVIEWTGSYSKVTNSGTTPTPGEQVGGGPPPAMEWETEDVTWSSIFDVDYVDSVRVDLWLSIDRHYEEEYTISWTDSDLNFHSSIFDASETITHKYIRDVTIVATSTHNSSNHAEWESGIVNASGNTTSYALGGYDLRSNDFAFQKEVMSITKTASGPFAAPVTTTIDINESTVFINSGIASEIGVISGSTVTTDNVSGASLLSLMMPGGGTFLDMDWRGYRGTAFIYNLLDGGKAQGLSWRSRWQDDSGTWHFDQWLTSGKLYSHSKLSDTSQSVADVAGFTVPIALMGIV